MVKRIVILHNIRSAYNVGSIFRTADAAGVTKIYLVGHTPTPIDRFGRKRKDITKVALGAEDTVLWEQVQDIHALIADLKGEKVRVIAVEQSELAQDYRTLSLSRDTAFIFGNEVNGIPPETLTEVDGVVEIPMQGRKESLNVSVTAGIILFQTHSEDGTFA